MASKLREDMVRYDQKLDDLFIKPVNLKEFDDYLSVVEEPMDLTTLG